MKNPGNKNGGGIFMILLSLIFLLAFLLIICKYRNKVNKLLIWATGFIIFAQFIVFADTDLVGASQPFDKTIVDSDDDYVLGSNPPYIEEVKLFREGAIEVSCGGFSSTFDSARVFLCTDPGDSDYTDLFKYKIAEWTVSEVQPKCYFLVEKDKRYLICLIDGNGFLITSRMYEPVPESEEKTSEI